MPEVTSRVSQAVRARRSIRDADFRNRSIRLCQIDAGFVNLRIGECGLRERHRIHRVSGVVPIDNDGRRISGRDIGAEVEYLHIPRLTSRVARFTARHGWNRYAIIRNGDSIGNTGVPIRPDTDRDTLRRTTGSMVPGEGCFTDGSSCSAV